jgi:hypothetical protein
LPYTWGDAKNGKLGLDLEGPDVEEKKEKEDDDPYPQARAEFIAQRSKIYNKKEKRIVAPCKIPHFAEARAACTVPALQAELYRQKYY